MGRLASRGPRESVKAAKALKADDRVRFRRERQARFKVRARGKRYVVLTKAFNLPNWGDGKSLYTVIDLDRGIRGTHNSWGHGAESEEEIAEMLAALEAGEIEISSRNNVSLEIKEVKPAPVVVE